MLIRHAKSWKVFLHSRIFDRLPIPLGRPNVSMLFIIAVSFDPSVHLAYFLCIGFDIGSSRLDTVLLFRAYIHGDACCAYVATEMLSLVGVFDSIALMFGQGIHTYMWNHQFDCHIIKSGLGS